MSRNPKRIDTILLRLGKVWKKNPDLRLCQLIENPFQDCCQYHIEDDIVIDVIEDFYKEDK